MANKIRLDQLLVDLGLVENASKARARIMAGDVVVNDHRADKPGHKYLNTVEVRLRGNSHPFVSRGGLKLEHALALWPAPIAGATCMDVGASTGGFTEVLLNNGARVVYAIDVGHGQLAEKLRTHPQVINMERTHILKLDQSALPTPPSVAVIDVSFISLTTVLPKVLELVARPAYVYALIKPQFEAGVERVESGGIVRNPDVHQECVDKIRSLATRLHCVILGVDESPILGGKGNKEFLIGLTIGL